VDRLAELAVARQLLALGGLAVGIVRDVSTPTDATSTAFDLRAAYLDLLKRGLCDLLGPQPMSAVPQSDGSVVVQLLPPEQLEQRETGYDWPANGTTMVGLRRLGSVQECIETIVRDGVPGDLIETGVWRGGTSIFMRGVLRALDDETRDVWLADSFEGLPAPALDEYPGDAGTEILERFKFLAVSREQVRAGFERFGLLDDHVRFLQGWFRDTLPPLRGRHQWSLLRLDGDMYESTIIALESLYDDLAVGGFVIVDDYGALTQCKAAVEDFRAARGIDDPIHRVDWTGAWWRRTR
jgi:O-methyltransferase